jgi:uncharacterized membrane protein
MTESPSSTAPRLPGIDILRGIAVAAMILFHFTWDLSFFKLIDLNVSAHWFWSNFARAIAGSFLLLSGIGLVLAERGGFDRSKFLKRLGLVAGAALLVSAGTFVATPNAFVFFGILHCIALSSVLALPFLRFPAGVTLVAAALIFAMPWFAAHPLFDQPLLRWVGLGTVSPLTNDYVPPFPWFAFVLIGVVIGRMIAARPPQWLLEKPRSGWDIAAQAGQWSLPIYLIHQPILMLLVYAAALALPTTGTDRVTREFRLACDETCMQSGGSAEVCMRYCTCSEAEIRNEKLWTPMISSQLTAEQSLRIRAITGQCTATARQ